MGETMKTLFCVLSLKIGLSLLAASILAGILGMCAVLVEDRKKCNISFACVVTQVGSGIVGIVVLICCGLVELWQ
jgi:hypothetical protein